MNCNRINDNNSNRCIICGSKAGSQCSLGNNKYRVKPRFLAKGKFPNGDEFEVYECAVDFKCFAEFLEIAYPTLIVDSITKAY
jgi:hypothetical protein